MKVPKCVLCEKKALTTAAQIPVCQEHWNAYIEEATQRSNRPFYTLLVNADARQRRKE